MEVPGVLRNVRRYRYVRHVFSAEYFFLSSISIVEIYFDLYISHSYLSMPLSPSFSLTISLSFHLKICVCMSIERNRHNCHLHARIQVMNS